MNKLVAKAVNTVSWTPRPTDSPTMKRLRRLAPSIAITFGNSNVATLAWNMFRDAVANSNSLPFASYGKKKNLNSCLISFILQIAPFLRISESPSIKQRCLLAVTENMNGC